MSSPGRKPPPTVAGRAVIVYQERPRQPWRLWVFTAVLVALTVGVILGQTVAVEPTYRSSSNAQAGVVPTAIVPALPSPGTLSQPWPDAAHQVTLPLGEVRASVLEVAGTSAVLRVRGADLGDKLVDVATVDRSAVPNLSVTERGPRLELIHTGDPGTVGAEIRLNAKVTWTLRLAGGSAEQTVDLVSGRVTAVDLTGDTAHATLRLPGPEGTVRLSLAGKVGDLDVRTAKDVPVRFRFKAGARTVVVDGKTRENVKPGTVLAQAGWRSADDRYDITVTGAVSSARAGAA